MTTPPQFYKTLNNLGYDHINIIDVGCFCGWLMLDLKPLLTIPSFCIGIDAQDYGTEYDLKSSGYDMFINKAIDDVKEEGKTKFIEYNDRMCSSLEEMNSNIVTHNKNDTNKWYVDRIIENKKSEREVIVTSLKLIADSIPKFQTEPIHFVKIDTQGTDIRVAKSLGEYLENTMFIQLECITSGNQNLILYKGQHLLDQDIKDMDNLGFKLYDLIDYKTMGLAPEGDVVFINKKIKV